MTDHQASRTLVKSPPELWAECSDAASLARHLDGCFGEIRITRLEPETSVAWEGERASGTVTIEPSAWGTRVTLTAQLPEEETPATGEEEEAPAPPAASPPPAAPGAASPPPAAPPAASPPPAPRGLRAWLRMRFRRDAPAAPASPASPADVEAPADAAHAEADAAPSAPAGPGSSAPPPPAPSEGPGASAPPPSPAVDAPTALAAALDSLGQAHHRPFSRG